MSGNTAQPDTSQSENASTPTLDGPPPFNNPSADVILRSADHVDFFVRKGILSEASPVFEAMFSLPPVPENRKRKAADFDASNDEEYRDGVPVVTATEDSDTLDALLRLCYPMDDPQLATPHAACAVLVAARKYDMDYAAKRASAQFIAHARADPLRVYALAIRNCWEDETRAAALHSLDTPLDGVYIAEMEDISAGAYFRLLEYHRACGAAASALVAVSPNDRLDRNKARRTLAWLKQADSDWLWLSCRYCAASTFAIGEQSVIKRAPAWWRQYLLDTAAALTAKPHRSTVEDPSLSSVVAHLAMDTDFCSYCRSAFAMDYDCLKSLASFTDQLADEIDNVVAKVELGIER
ncbi:hypothetical protein SCP_0905610 [Sparassis crispa]|uniref:BTB domain-containing protein n=1 Tax=Sparassis crispa TaxID=139825 RepID=A0A401GWT5_9APHY|nr:hypothetical protein SCP_0905610 [Sparassis crispa]GBE86681.1 hypothetical protein SCP_0905610 [Sparassis crispa]